MSNRKTGIPKKSIVFYTTEQNNQIKKYKISEKRSYANNRFGDEKIYISDVLEMLEKFNFRCLYCDSELDAKTWQLDHFHSKASGGKNKIENLAPSCKWCNLMKNALDGHGFLHRCKVISENNFFKKYLDDNYYPKTIPNRKPCKIDEININKLK